jgi:tetratricopeptide (TPR) repeat protein
LNKALKLARDSSIYYLANGGCENTRGNYEKGVKYTEKALAIDSSHVDYLWNIGQAYMALGKYNEALDSFMKWLNKQTDISNPWINGMHRIGYTLFKLGRFDEAEFYFDKQLEYCLTHIELNYKYAQMRAAHYDLAGVYAFTGDKEKAYQYLNEFSTRESFPLWWVSLFKDDPLFDSIRDEPEFQQILSDVESKYQAEHERVRQWLEENDML